MHDPCLPPAVAALRDGVRRALDGGPAVTLLPRTTTADPPTGTALVVRTSGSTGAPREVALGGDALMASAAATHERLGGPGRWVLTLPPTHVAGAQVVVRSVLAGTPLVAADQDAPFTPDGAAELLTEALRAAGNDPVYLSLVPTQLHRLVAAADDGEARGLRELSRCAGVLLGGAATAPGLLARARGAGVRVVTTYGMSETAGGCVYDGVPLRDVRVRLAPTSSGDAGVIELGGPTLAHGYLGDPAETAAAFRRDPDGTRWFRTNDLGTIGRGGPDDGVLRVLGRADDVVVTGGENVAPAPVEALVGELLGGEACVVGVPDPEWGQAVVALVAGTPPSGVTGSPSRRPDADEAVTPDPDELTALAARDLARVRSVVADKVGPPSAPRRVYRAAALPVRGPGKVDRAGVAALVRAHEARTGQHG